MALVYRTAGDWGAGKGSNLTPNEVDLNFWQLLQMVEALPELPDLVSISSITSDGSQMTIHMSDGSEFVLTMPIATFTFVGEWTPSTSYPVNTVFYAIGLTVDPNDDGVYLVRKAHTTDTDFDPDRIVSGSPAYELIFPLIPGPQGEQGEPGTPGEGLPEILTADEGKYLSVVGGEAAWVELEEELPEVQSGFEGRVLTIYGGEPAWREPFLGELKTVSTATYTLIASDGGKYIRFTNAAGCVVSIDPNVLALNDQVLMRGTQGQVELDPATGFTLNYPDTHLANSRQEMSTIHLYFVSAAEADLMGDLEEAP